MSNDNPNADGIKKVLDLLGDYNYEGKKQILLAVSDAVDSDLTAEIEDTKKKLDYLQKVQNIAAAC